MLFTEQDKQIFEYTLRDGVTKKFADPLKVYRQFRSKSDGNLADWIKDNTNTALSEQIRSNIIRDIAKVVIESFDGEPFNPETGTGWTETFCVQLAVQFYVWKGELKKNGEMKPTTPSPGVSSEAAKVQ